MKWASLKSYDVPIWLCRHVSKQDLANIAAAVQQAELRTSGEIVPMIVRRSTFAPPVFLIALLTLLLLLSLSHVWHWELLHLGRQWEVAFALLDAVLLIGVAAVLARIPYLQYLLTPREQMARMAEMRAQNEFFAANLNQTKGGTGILIFISMFEHRAVILADQTIAAKLPTATWDTIVAELVWKIKQKRFAEGLVQAIQQCALITSKEFPARPDDVNELPNRLVIKE